MQTGKRTMDAISGAVTAEGMKAFGELWNALESSMVWFARQVTNNRQDRNDALQDTMLELYCLDPARYNFRDPGHLGYLRRILIARMFAVWGNDPDFTLDDLQAMMIAQEKSRVRSA